MHSWGSRPSQVWWSAASQLVNELTATWSGILRSSKIRDRWIGQDCRPDKNNQEVFSWAVKLWNALCCHFLVKWREKEIQVTIWARSPQTSDSWPRRNSGGHAVVAKTCELVEITRKSNCHSNKYVASCIQISRNTLFNWLSSKIKIKLRLKSSLWYLRWSSLSSFRH